MVENSILDTDRISIDEVMSNFDHSIDRVKENILKTSFTYGQYSAWNFCGYVWFDNNKFYCEIWRYNSPIDTVVTDSLDEIMDLVSENYGYE